MKEAMTLGKFVAIEPVPFSKVEAKIGAGIATVAQRTDVVVVSLVMDFYDDKGNLYYIEQDKVILKGTAGLEGWNKTKYEYNGKQFVLCPIEQILGIERNRP
jgi:hypothetical protein